jgi:hypothetical protein
MKLFCTILLSLAATRAGAYPQGSISSSQTRSETQNATAFGQQAVSAIKSGSAAQADPSFDAALQKIDVNGLHAFKAPGPNDARGPCPGEP